MRGSVLRPVVPSGEYPCRMTEARRVRIEVDSVPEWGTREGDEIVLADGRRLPEAEVAYLAPVQPSKIIAVHLTYRSRIDEYGAKVPPEPSYFMKPPTTLNGHRGVLRRPRGARFLNYEGELAVSANTLHVALTIPEDEAERMVTEQEPA